MEQNELCYTDEKSTSIIRYKMASPTSIATGN